MSTIEGNIDPTTGDAIVTINHHRPLPPRLDLANHSPTGFQWGYGGSGPAQLALAMLAYLYDDDTAQRYHQAFKWDVIIRLPMNEPFTLDTQSVRDWMEQQVEQAV